MEGQYMICVIEVNCLILKSYSSNNDIQKTFINIMSMSSLFF
jgi:hypothetical protein